MLYSNQGADALGRLLVVNQDNPANPQNAVRIQNSGTASTVSIFHDPAGGAGDSSAEAVDIVSTNPLDTTLGVRGREEGRGTVKITHEKPARSDANAAALSIALTGAGTAAQGIFIGNDAGNPTTGPLLNIRNGGPDAKRLVLTADGKMQLPVQGPLGGLVIGIRRKPLPLGGGRAGDGRRHRGRGRGRADERGQGGRERASTRWRRSPPSTTIAIGAGGGLRGLKVAAAISVSGALAPTSLWMFNLASAVTPSAKTDLKSVEVYKSSPQINGLPGVDRGRVRCHVLELPAPAPAESDRERHRLLRPRLRALRAADQLGRRRAGPFPHYSAVRIEAPGGEGTITQLVGIDIRDFKGRGANNYSLRSFGNARPHAPLGRREPGRAGDTGDAAAPARQRKRARLAHRRGGVGQPAGACGRARRRAST